MSENRPDPPTAPPAGRRSVTLLETPFVGGDTLPPDLLAAFNLAAHAVTNARQIVFTCQMFAKAEGGDDATEGYAKVITESAREIWAEYPCHSALTRVMSELAVVVETGSNFGGSSAHESALSFADLVLDRVWWVADPLHYSDFRKLKPIQLDGSRIVHRLMSIANQLAKKQFPDADKLIQACQTEARKAAAKRSPVERAPVTELAGVPTVWFHGNRCYSVDGLHMRAVSVEEDTLLQAFMTHSAALDPKALEHICGPHDFIKIVDGLRAKFQGLFAKAVPKMSPRQVYSVRVRKVQRSKTNL